VLTDDFISVVALEELRARLATGHMARWIRHEDGLLLDAIHQQTVVSSLPVTVSVDFNFSVVLYASF
jgi:hypothetical protein